MNVKYCDSCGQKMTGNGIGEAYVKFVINPPAKREPGDLNPQRFDLCPNCNRSLIKAVKAGMLGKL